MYLSTSAIYDLFVYISRAETSIHLNLKYSVYCYPSGY